MNRTIAVFLPNWIGDVVMATPTLRNLRQHVGPNTTILGVARPYIEQVLTGSSWLDDLLWYDPRAQDPGLRAGSLIQRLRSRRVEDVLLLTNSLRSAWIAYRSGAKRRVGYRRNGRGWLLTERLTAPRVRWRYSPVSAVDYYLRIAGQMGVCIQSRQPELYTTAKGELAADEVWANLGWQPQHVVVALNTGGAYGGAKHWPNQHSAQLARKLASTGLRVLIMCGPMETDVARDIEHRAAHPFVRSMANQDLSLEASKACLRRSQVVVSTDSGPRHIASAFDVPTVVLFGPIHPAWSYNYASRSIEIYDNLGCSPCGRRTCPLGHHRCMNDITPDRVYHAVSKLLGNQPADRAA